ncbi:MAG: hypothetical protein AABY95_03715 [Pseudomonadota bacterium]
MSFTTDILEMIKQQMPADADIVEASSLEGYVVNVSWKLDDDPERPNKPTKTISIHVSHEATEDFAAASKTKHAEAYKRISAFLAQKLAAFDPANNAPKYSPPPVEKWVITTNVLFG